MGWVDMGALAGWKAQNLVLCRKEHGGYLMVPAEKHIKKTAFIESNPQNGLASHSIDLDLWNFVLPLSEAGG